MNEHPILFNAAMVRAVLDGRKTQTRRVVRFPKHAHQPNITWIASVNLDGAGGWIAWGPHGVTDDFSKKAYPAGGGFKCPYGQPGDLLWVRETWGALWLDEEPLPLEQCKIEYRADLSPGCTDYPGGWPAEKARDSDDAPRWRPSVHMPRWASRITLKVTGVRIERLQDITGSDVAAEGIDSHVHPAADYSERAQREAFAELWDSIYARRGYSWDSNPWIWVVSFLKT